LFPVAVAGLGIMAFVEAHDGQRIDWRTFDLNGKTLALVDDRRIEEYDLTRDGLAVASSGIKGVAATGPVYYWRLANHTLLLSEEPGAAAFQAYELLSTKGDIVNARNTSGKIMRFRLSPFKTLVPAP
jgi:hypothetical protein